MLDEAILIEVGLSHLRDTGWRAKRDRAMSLLSSSHKREGVKVPTVCDIEGVTASWVVVGIHRVTILSLYQSPVSNKPKYRRLRLSCCNKPFAISQLPSSS